ncbi:portal protein [Rosistilla oblonga]|uniref:portal protein n=1 Tax=Rosistilla oblonga TaxID=2527990 RepID=UPI003A97C937
MSDSIANDVIVRENTMRSDRVEFDAMWAEIAGLIDPLSTFNTNCDPERGRLGRVFNSRPVLALERAASAATSLLIPSGDMWHGLKPVDEDLVGNKEVSDYVDTYRNRLFSWRYDSKAGFQSAFGPAYREMMAYGVPCVHIEERFGGDAPFLYRFIPLSQVVFSTDAAGIEDTVFRKYPMTAKQMAQQFGESKLAEPVKKVLEDPKLRGEKHFTVIHAVYPRTSDKSRFAFDDVYIDADNKKVLREGGAFEMAYMMSSFGRVDPKLPYGYSPGLRAVADIKGANHAKRLFLRAAEKIIDPPIGVSDDYEGVANLNAGSLMRGAFNSRGQQLMGPIGLGGNPNLGNDTFEMFTNDVNASFYLDLFAAILNKPSMTATEVLSIMEERANLLSPPFEQQEGMLGRCIAREISIINRKAENGEIDLPVMPDVLRDNGGIDLEFTSPLSQLRRAKQANANMQAIRAVGEIAQLDPGVLDTVDFDEAAYQVGKSFGGTSTIWRDEKQVEQIRAARAEQEQQAQQQAQQAQQVEQVAKMAPAMKMMNEGA